MATEYQGGGEAVLTGFFNTINSAYARNSARIAQEAQAEAKAQQAYQEDLTGMMKKINPAGVQKVDVPELAEKQALLKELYFKAGKASTTKERLELTAELQQGINDLGQFIAASKQRGQEEYKLGEYIGNPRNMGLVAQDAKDKYAKLLSTPTSKLPSGSLSTNNFTLPDTSYLSKVIDDTAKDMLGRAGEKIRIGGQVSFGNGGSGTQVFTEKDVKQEAFGTALFDVYNRDVKAKNLIDYTASQMGLQPQQYLTQVAQQYANRGQLRSSKVDVKSNPKPPKSGGDSSDSKSANTYRQQLLEGILSEDQDAIGRANASVLPGGSVQILGKGKNKIIRVKAPFKSQLTGLTKIETYDIKTSNPNAYTQLNTYLNQATGEKISPSKAGILKGKPTGKLAEPVIRNTAPKSTPKTPKSLKGALDDL